MFILTIRNIYTMWGWGYEIIYDMSKKNMSNTSKHLQCSNFLFLNVENVENTEKISYKYMTFSKPKCSRISFANNFEHSTLIKKEMSQYKPNWSIHSSIFDGPSIFKKIVIYCAPFTISPNFPNSLDIQYYFYAFWLISFCSNQK